MIVYMSPGSPEGTSGGTRKLYDHVAILQANGFDARIAHTNELAGLDWNPERDIVVCPEVYGDALNHLIPHPVRRIGFVQNSYLVSEWGVSDPEHRHPYLDTEDLAAVFTESQHSTDRMRELFPTLAVPLIRTHSSGNGRNGHGAGFSYGDWPREKRVAYFQYKHDAQNARLFEGLELPDGWELSCMTGLTDDEIAAAMRTAAMFVATNESEGMCAPTSEAMIAGCVIVAWPGGPTGQRTTGGPMEYLLGRAIIADQDDIDGLRDSVTMTARAIDESPITWSLLTRLWSDWFQTEYSREREIDELCSIFDDLHGR